MKGLFALLLAGLLLVACGKDDEGGPVLGQLTGTVLNGADNSPLENSSIIVFNANDNAPVITLNTDASGNFSTDLEPGNYFVKAVRQGFLSVPPAGISAVPFTIIAGQEVVNDVTMFASDATNIGQISGRVTASGAGVAGILIIAENGTDAYSAVSDEDGNYHIYNVAAGSYDVDGWAAGYNSNGNSASVTANTETTNIDLTLTEGANGSLSGQVRNIAAENKDVDVALIHPITRETIPGLTGRTVSQSYNITNIPNGVYIARATFENDVRVMDPDRIFKFGEPVVEMGGGSQLIDFDITNSVTLNSPSNEAGTTIPTEITSKTPTFTWNAYSSTSEYVIEVTDATTGNVIWGGIDQSGDLPTKNIIIPSSQTSIAYNSDGNASSALEVGKVYRWRIYASKNDQNSDTGWTLISASEDQQGLIRIVE